MKSDQEKEGRGNQSHPHTGLGMCSLVTKLITCLSAVYLSFRHSLHYLKMWLQMFTVAQKQFKAQLLNKQATEFVNASKASKAWQSQTLYTENQTSFSK